MPSKEDQEFQRADEPAKREMNIDNDFKGFAHPNRHFVSSRSIGGGEVQGRGETAVRR